MASVVFAVHLLLPASMVGMNAEREELARLEKFLERVEKFFARTCKDDGGDWDEDEAQVCYRIVENRSEKSVAKSG